MGKNIGFLVIFSNHIHGLRKGECHIGFHWNQDRWTQIFEEFEAEDF